MKLKISIICAATLSAAVLSGFQAASAQSVTGLGLHTVVIDPGHGGKDPGAVSKDGKLQEKQVVLDISKRLKEKIEAANPDVKVYLTREKDGELLPLIDRARFASGKNADLFISVHINSNQKTSPNGYSIHLLGQSTDKNKDTYAFNMDVCKRENEVITLEDDYTTTYQGFDPKDPESDIFLHLMHNAFREQSLIFAQMVDQKLAGGPIARSNGIMQNNFAVLRQASMPAVLLELGFISNSQDIVSLKSSSSLDRIAASIADAFSDYKTFYNESVGAVEQTPVTAAETAAPVQSPAAESDSPYYGVQVLASARSMKENDPYFLGYTMKSIRSGSLYKYIIGISDDVEIARENAKEIRKKYPDAFLVKVVGTSCTRVY